MNNNWTRIIIIGHRVVLDSSISNIKAIAPTNIKFQYKNLHNRKFAVNDCCRSGRSVQICSETAVRFRYFSFQLPTFSFKLVVFFVWDVCLCVHFILILFAVYDCAHIESVKWFEMRSFD